MISIVIPLYNKEKYILRAIQSVLEQDFSDFELIIVDDGSTDNSLTVLKDVLDDRIRVIEQANQGVGSARNKGMIEANYKWIALLDADDAWHRHHLSELADIIKRYPDSGLISTRFLELDQDDELITNNESLISHIKPINYFLEASKKLNIVHSSSVAISKEVFYKIGGFSDKKIGEDLEYWAKVALSYPVAVSDKATSYYFRGTNGVMESLDKKDIKDQFLLNELSSPVSFLFEESIKRPYITKDKNIRRYINSRLFNAVKVSLFNKKISIAKMHSKQALPQFNFIFLFLFLFQLTPNMVLGKIINLYFFVRNKT